MNYRKTLLVGFLVLTNHLLLIAQVGIGTTSPDPSSMLDISSTDAGILVPRMSELQKDAILDPKKGLLIFQNDEIEGFWFYNGLVWTPIDNKGEFVSIGNVIRNTTSTKVDDFVVGSTSLDNIIGTDDDRRFFFDKGKGALRSGFNNDTSWDQANLGNHSVGIGYNNTASSPYTVSLGRETIASADYAVSIGRSNTVSGINATSFGYINTASGMYSTTFGRGNTASGQNTIAAGVASTASGLNAIALGNTNSATAENSFASGRLSSASALNTVAIGFTNEASAEGAFALGQFTKASGVNSIALGNDLVTPSFNEVAVGLYNIRYTPISTTTTAGEDRIFTVGNGFRTGGVTTYNNAFTILKNGQVGIGTDTPGEALEIHGDDNFSGDADFDAHSYGTNITSFHIRSASGTQASPGPVSGKSNANYYNMEAQGYDGATYRNASAIRMGSMANSRTGLGDMPGRIDFHTSADGTVNNELRMRIDDNGNVGIGTKATALTAKLEVKGKIKAENINFSNLSVFANDSAAGSGGLETGDMYRTAAGVLRIKL